MNWRVLLRIAVLLTTAGVVAASGGSSSNDCTQFGAQNCQGANNAGCYPSTNTCQCCWGVQSGSTFQCYQYDSTPACASRGYGRASNGLCVFLPPPAGPACSGGGSSGGCNPPPNCASGTHQGPNCTCVPN